MFKNIQKNLLLRHPLLWNTRIVPILAIAVVLHLIFFIIGYVHGAIDFTPQPGDYFFDATTGIITFFSIAISILIFIFWLVYYTRNNAFKSFYPKSGLSLFKEWLIILLVCVLNSAYFGSYLFGEDVRARSYFSEKEFSRRINIISTVSLFADGGFEDDGYYYEKVNGEDVRKHRDWFLYQGHKYSIKSLLNKGISKFTYQDKERDSLNELKVKGWLINNKKDSVLLAMREFDKIAKEHGAIGNITPDKWLGLVYDNPDFTNFLTIARLPRYDEGDSSSRYGHNDVNYNEVNVVAIDSVGGGNQSEIDTISNVIKIIDGQAVVFPKYYVPLKQLEDSYSDISKAYTSPSVDDTFLLAMLYFSLCFSLAIFSFRVTSGRDWIIAILAFGVAALITGILQVTLLSSLYRMNYRSGESFYWILWLIILAVLAILFLRPKLSKGNSAIFLNIILWLCPWVLITIVIVAKSFMYYDSGEFEYGYWELTPTGQWINDNFEWIMLTNALIIIIFMFFFTKTIKRWKGVAEA